MSDACEINPWFFELVDALPIINGWAAIDEHGRREPDQKQAFSEFIGREMLKTWISSCIELGGDKHEQ
jgi:hypothetical protein